MNKKIKALLTISFVCIVSSLLSGCGSVEETACIETEGQERNGLVYLPNQEEPFTGKNLCKYENGQNKAEGKYKDGYQEGKWTYWYENGQKSLERNYKDGKKDGKWTEWNSDGTKHLEGNYKDGEKDGKWTSWSYGPVGGVLVRRIYDEKNYKDGVLID